MIQSVITNRKHSCFCQLFSTDVTPFRLWQRCTYQINDVTICHDRQLDFYNVSGGVSRIIYGLKSMNYLPQNQIGSTNSKSQ